MKYGLLIENEESLSKYPFKFMLRIGYVLNGSELSVNWEVTNTNDSDMYFAIGAHPAFAVPTLAGHSFKLYDKTGDAVATLQNRIFGLGGCVTERFEEVYTPDGVIEIDEELFDNDALVIENGQVGRVDLLDSKGAMMVSVKFDAPLVGLWSPPHKNAPFVCIEPWYGRCDCETFTGELQEREFEQKLSAGEVFKADYSIGI